MHASSTCGRLRSLPTLQRRLLLAAPAGRNPFLNLSTSKSTLASSSGALAPTGAATSSGGTAAAAVPATAGTATALADVTIAQFPVNFLTVRGVLFDVDGTLVDSDPLHFQAFQEILAEVGFNGGRPIDEAFFRRHISGRHNPEIAADLFPDWDENRRTAFYLDKEERYRRLAAAGLEPLEGLREFFEWVRQRGLRTAAVTNAPRANAEMILAALGIESCFEHLVLGEECTRAKPHPDPYLIAMELLGLTPGESVVFEDSPSGVAAGVAAGATVIALTTGQDPAVLQQAGAVWIVRNFRDVMAAIQAAETSADSTARGGEGSLSQSS
ncbi:hypothetical protein VaNZ11_012916 [Volvox africanus]|uniref:Haloacid dehalogenase-like hydrolase domain-containing protein Sgpp n=1 Tax=Volvox africanus TaxID=51714 RepID=A0ABQ5SH50_9CHLO|nr:hypothetical protein VaNZ11_012916 [Volvox africanus]